MVWREREAILGTRRWNDHVLNRVGLCHHLSPTYNAALSSVLKDLNDFFSSPPQPLKKKEKTTETFPSDGSSTTVLQLNGILMREFPPNYLSTEASLQSISATVVFPSCGNVFNVGTSNLLWLILTCGVWFIFFPPWLGCRRCSTIQDLIWINLKSIWAVVIRRNSWQLSSTENWTDHRGGICMS